MREKAKTENFYIVSFTIQSVQRARWVKSSTTAESPTTMYIMRETAAPMPPKIAPTSQPEIAKIPQLRPPIIKRIKTILCSALIVINVNTNNSQPLYKEFCFQHKEMCPRTQWISAHPFSLAKEAYLHTSPQFVSMRLLSCQFRQDRQREVF